MSYTKGQFASAALEEIGIAEYEYDISPEQKQSVIQKLDAMMALWNIKGLLLSYPISSIDGTDVDQETGVPDWANEAVVTNLAIKIAPSYGKAVSPETKIAAKEGYNTICGIFAKPREMQMDSMPVGAGYKRTDNRWSSAPKQVYVEPVDEEIDLSRGVADE